MLRRLTTVIAILASTALVASRRRAVSAPPPLDMHRSFAVTDEAILAGFSFERVMNAIGDGDGLGLYRQWFDTQNPAPGLDPAAPHCDDASQLTYGGTARRCPTPEGTLAGTNPFVPPQYVPLALINRFDMAPADGANCGQYRIAYARRGAAAADRLHVIFEAVLPNPDPAAGLAGCRPVAQFWADLSTVGSSSERRARLEQFFFGDVLRRANFTTAAGGGIRAFHDTVGSGAGPRFYQFRIDDYVRPDGLENTPPAAFFDATNNEPQAVRFREELVRQLADLAVPDVNGFSMKLPRELLTPESDGRSFGLVFSDALNSSEGQQFNVRIEQELRRIGSSLTGGEIVRRVETQTCAGCHAGSGAIGDGLVFPRSFGFEHLSEDRSEAGEDGRRYSLSPAMTDVFIPGRMRILRDFLAFGSPPGRSN